MSVLKVEFINQTCKATINRPKAHNAVNFAVMNALEELLDRLESDAKIRCLILRGAGSDAFISGGDLREFHTIKTASGALSMAERMASILERLETLPCWTIACINASVYGGGCEIMLAFDFRIAANETTFGFTQGKFYLPPGWGGLTRLVERVGRSTALRWLAEMAVITTQTALDHTLIDRVASFADLELESLRWAEQLCYNDRDYIHALKKGALVLTEARWKAIKQELKPFGKFWEDERHHRRVGKFLNKDK